MTLVDTNILLDLVTDDSDCPGLSVGKLEEVALKGVLAINDAVLSHSPP